MNLNQKIKIIIAICYVIASLLLTGAAVIVFGEFPKDSWNNFGAIMTGVGAMGSGYAAYIAGRTADVALEIEQRQATRIADEKSQRALGITRALFNELQYLRRNCRSAIKSLVDYSEKGWGLTIIEIEKKFSALHLPVMDRLVDKLGDLGAASAGECLVAMGSLLRFRAEYFPDLRPDVIPQWAADAARPRLDALRLVEADLHRAAKAVWESMPESTGRPLPNAE